MRRPLKRELSDILTCTVGNVEETYDRILEVFQKRAKLGIMTFFRAVEIDGKAHYDGLRGRGDSEALDMIDELQGRPLLQGPTLDVFRPGHDEINEFVTQHVDDPRFEGTPIERRLLTPLEIHSALRIMVYRGEEFVGWVGCFRRADQPRCDAKLRRKVEVLRKPLCAALSAVDQLHRQELIDESACAVFEPGGQLEYASAEAGEFLDGERRQAMGHLVRGLDGGEVENCLQAFYGVEVRLTRLEGQGGVRYLAQLIPPEIPELDPESHLTPTQRQVVDYAVAGATTKEIARAMGRSPETIKVHFKNVYDRLGIGSRAELAAKFAG